MRVMGFSEFGGPEVFKVLEREEPHAGTGEVRIRMRAALGLDQPLDHRVQPTGRAAAPAVDHAAESAVAAGRGELRDATHALDCSLRRSGRNRRLIRAPRGVTR